MSLLRILLISVLGFSEKHVFLQLLAVCIFSVTPLQ